MLQLDHICKSFGDKVVLRDVSLTVQAGEVVGLLGGNGAGKTTLLRIATLLLEPDSGTVTFDGHPMGPADMARVGYLPEERGLYRHSRVGSQAVYLARLKGMSRRDAEASLHAWFKRLDMEEWWNRPASSLSKGMLQRLQFVVSVVHNPALLILDEPFSGFDAAAAEVLRREIKALQQTGTAILLSTHNLQAAAELCDKTLKL